MTVYVDDMHEAPLGKFRRMKMCHMVADTELELEQMAERIGVALKWWQYKGTRKTHFDICMSKRAAAVLHGAVEVSFHDLGWMLRGRRSAADPLREPGDKS